MQLAGVSDFGFNDILKPDSKRTRRNLSALINFCRFKEDEAMAEHDHQRGVEEIDLKISEASESQKILRRIVEQSEAELSDEKVACNKLLAEEKTILQEMEHLNIPEVQNGIECCRHEAVTVTEEISNVDNDIQLIGDVLQCLQARIIVDMDPAELLHQTNQLREGLVQKADLIQQKESCVEERKHDTCKAEKSIKRCNVFLEKREKLKIIVDESHALELEMRQLKRDLEERKKEVEIAQIEEREFDKQLSVMSTRVEKVLQKATSPIMPHTYTLSLPSRRHSSEVEWLSSMYQMYLSLSLHVFLFRLFLHHIGGSRLPSLLETLKASLPIL